MSLSRCFSWQLTEPQNNEHCHFLAAGHRQRAKQPPPTPCSDDDEGDDKKVSCFPSDLNAQPASLIVGGTQCDWVGLSGACPFHSAGSVRLSRRTLHLHKFLSGQALEATLCRGSCFIPWAHFVFAKCGIKVTVAEADEAAEEGAIRAASCQLYATCIRTQILVCKFMWVLIAAVGRIILDAGIKSRRLNSPWLASRSKQRGRLNVKDLGGAAS